VRRFDLAIARSCSKGFVAPARCAAHELGSIVRRPCRTPGAESDAPTFDIVTTPNATQRHALDLIRQIRP
jgi:hypothetical protein